ncbi:MAG TPA: hypothetical protein VF897_02405 [Roseiflexaceae bacterium]
MKRTIKGIAFTAVIALSLLASAGGAFARDAKHARETAWTEGPLLPQGVTWESQPLGVTWEE